MKDELMKLSKQELIKELFNNVQNLTAVNSFDFKEKVTEKNNDPFLSMATTFNILTKNMEQFNLHRY